MKKTYNLIKANELFSKYVSETGFDVNDKSRKPRAAYQRSLLYKILKDKAHMNDRMISAYLKDNFGLIKNRASIYCSLDKIDTYYLNYEEFRDNYDKFFNDKKHKREAKERRKRDVEKRRNNELKFRNSINNHLKNKDALDRLIDSLPVEKRGEIFDMVELRVKSWSWKNEDKCQIIDCSSSMQGLVF